MTAAYFMSLLKNHDWHYHRSDDRRAYQRGKEQAAVIRQAADADPALQAILDEYVAQEASR